MHVNVVHTQTRLVSVHGVMLVMLVAHIAHFVYKRMKYIVNSVVVNFRTNILCDQCIQIIVMSMESDIHRHNKPGVKY